MFAATKALHILQDWYAQAILNPFEYISNLVLEICNQVTTTFTNKTGQGLLCVFWSQTFLQAPQ